MTKPSGKRIAVLGAGIQGACAALELAEKGHCVDLVEREDDALTAASLWNEGKIHLGFLFANDAVERTAARLIEGARRFAPILERYVDSATLKRDLSQSFIYAVHKDSLLDAACIERHFDAVAKAIRSRRFENGGYFGDSRAHEYRRLNRCELEEIYNPELVSAAFETKEISVNTQSIAIGLRAVIKQHPRIDFLRNLDVADIGGGHDNGYVVRVVEKDGRNSTLGEYHAVVNALGSDRLRIDAAMGLRPSRSFRFRFKLALHLSNAELSNRLRSTTLVLGQFGDIVVFPSGRLYLSWYPACLRGASAALQPPRWDLEQGDYDLDVVQDETFEHLCEITPHLGPARICKVDVDIRGGVIFAWGAGDIDDLGDEIHRRFEIGVVSKGNYHSVDTGKYGMAPFFAERLAERIGGT